MKSVSRKRLRVMEGMELSAASVGVDSLSVMEAMETSTDGGLPEAAAAVVPAVPAVPHHERVVELLNQMSAPLVSEAAKLGLLAQVQDIVVHREPGLLDNFLDEILVFQGDRSPLVRTAVVGFIQEACCKDPDTLPKVVGNLQLLMSDPAVVVQKRALRCLTQLFPVALAWLASAKTVTEVMVTAWGMLGRMKRHVFDFVDSDNDGIRTMAVRLMEMVVLLQTYTEQNSFVREGEFCLDDVPLTLKVARPRKLEEEARVVFEKLLQFHGSAHISSANLMTCMGTLTHVAQLRPQFMGKAVAALEMLHANLPPTLGKSQVSSVRKHLKLKLLGLLRHPAANDYHTNITTLLTDLGATQQEIVRCLPRHDQLRKRVQQLGRIDGSVAGIKRLRLDEEEEEEEDEDEASMIGQPAAKRKQPNAAIDITEKHVLERLTPDVAANLVLVSMLKLPESMPPHFSSIYTPIAAAGTEGQIKHVARLLAMQLTAASLGPGAEQARRDVDIKPFNFDDDDDDSTVIGPSSKNSIATLMGGTASNEERRKPPASLLPTGVSQRAKQKIRTSKLAEITRPMEPPERRRHMISAIRRILQAETSAVLGGVSEEHSRIITTIAVQMDEEVQEMIMEFIFKDLRYRCDLAFSWIYEEYSYMQGFMPGASLLRSVKDDDSYNRVFCRFIRGFLERADPKDKDALLFRLYLEAPIITEQAVDLLKQVCQDEARAAAGITLLKELVVRRLPKQLLFLNTLLEFNAHEEAELRTRAISAVIKLYEHGDLRTIIEEYAIMYLKFLLLPQPPEMLFGTDRGRPEVVLQWTEDIVRACLYLYLALLPVNEKMIHELATVYVQTNADVKRTVLRLLEKPVKGMGMDSPELLRLVENCPKGAETLVTRVIHILTDKTPPSSQLVARVRDLYHKRVSDVRFLIPVLNGLTKKEVIAALPKLIKLNPVVVKEVFNRLLGTHVDVANHTSPLTPAELLVALHNLDHGKCDVKTVIKATSLCFGEKQIYTQEVLAVVMQQLMEQSPLPTLLMRTVIQSLSLYPRLIGFVMNILQRLILKQVWKQKKVWEGFIKCCQRTKPQSFQVLLQLPTTQLREVFSVSPDLREPLLGHVMSLTESQRAHIPQSIMDVLMGVPASLEDEVPIKEEPPSPPDLTIDMKEDGDEVIQTGIKVEDAEAY